MSIEREKPLSLKKKLISSFKETVIFPHRHIKFAEADKKELEAAKWLVADRYKDHAPELSDDEVYDMLCADERYLKEHSITLVALHKKEVIGTLQLTFGENIEAMDLMEITEGAPHNEGESIGEFGRFAIRRGYDGPRAPILSALTKKGLELAKNKRHVSLDTVYAIMPPKIREYYESEGIYLQPVLGALPRENDKKAREVFESFPGYWRRNPGLYIYPDSLIHEEKR